MDDIVDLIESALAEMEQFAQPRSDFALAHFVVGQHDLPARQRRQALEELQSLLYAIFDLRDRKELAEIDLAEVEASPGESKFERRRRAVKARQLRREMWNIDYMLRGREQEAKTLLKILEVLPQCAREDLESQEAEYWQRRLTRQYVENQLGGGGNLSALAQMISQPGQAMASLPGQKNIMKTLSGGEK